MLVLPTPRTRRVRRALASAAALLALSAGCSHDDKLAKSATDPHGVKPVCGVDEAREFFCDELLPRESSKPAAAPYSDCPDAVDDHAGEIDPEPGVAGFDADYTRHIRLRAPPGNACCYSRCSKLAVVPPTEIPENNGCNDVLAFREHWCTYTLESGTSEPASAPFERCPLALRPPATAVFASPKGAPFDAQYTWQKRQQGFNECCYTWCSHRPAGITIQ